MLEVTVKDEATRTALEYALWTYGSELVSAETLYEQMWNVGWELIGVYDPADVPSAEEADQRLRGLQAARGDIDVVRAASLGDAIELMTEVAGVVTGLRDCLSVIQGDPTQDRRFKPLAVLARIEDIRTAVTSLLTDLASAGAVA